MKEKEVYTLLLAAIIMTLVVSFIDISNFAWDGILRAAIFSIIVIGGATLGRKIVAYKLDASVTHEIWHWQRFGFGPSQKLKKPAPTGIIVPLIFTLFTLGALKVHTYLTYETEALKRRAAKRHGHYSFTEMTDWHIALIGGAGVATSLLISFISYWIPGLEGLPSIAAYYAFFNLIPFSKLDGAQIYYGSRLLWTTLAVITLIIIAFALLVV